MKPNNVRAATEVEYSGEIHPGIPGADDEQIEIGGNHAQ